MEMSQPSPNVGYFFASDPVGDGNVLGGRVSRASAADALGWPKTIPVAMVTGYMTQSAVVTGFNPNARPALNGGFGERGYFLAFTYDTWWWDDEGHPDGSDNDSSVFLLELTGAGQEIYTAPSDPSNYGVDAYTSSDSGQLLMIYTPSGQPVVIDTVKVWRIEREPDNIPDTINFWTNLRNCKEIPL